MTFYAWIGRRDGDNFDEDTVRTSQRPRRSQTRDADSLLVRGMMLPQCCPIGGDDGSIIVDLDRYSSIEFTIQLQDEDGNALEREGVEIEVEVDKQRDRGVDAEVDDQG